MVHKLRVPLILATVICLIAAGGLAIASVKAARKRLFCDTFSTWDPLEKAQWLAEARADQHVEIVELGVRDGKYEDVPITVPPAPWSFLDDDLVMFRRWLPNDEFIQRQRRFVTIGLGSEEELVTWAERKVAGQMRLAWGLGVGAGALFVAGLVFAGVLYVMRSRRIKSASD